jgi:hypothetical protein
MADVMSASKTVEAMPYFPVKLCGHEQNRAKLPSYFFCPLVRA